MFSKGCDELIRGKEAESACWDSWVVEGKIPGGLLIAVFISRQEDVECAGEKVGDISVMGCEQSYGKLWSGKWARLFAWREEAIHTFYDGLWRKLWSVKWASLLACWKESSHTFCVGLWKKLCSFKMGKVARMKEGGSSEAHLYALFMLEARMKVQALVKDIEFRHYW